MGNFISVSLTTLVVFLAMITSLAAKPDTIKKLNICYAYANIIRFLKIRKALNRLLANSLICPPYTKEVTSKPR